MKIKSYLSRLVAFVLVVVIGCVGAGTAMAINLPNTNFNLPNTNFSVPSSNLSGDYTQDTIAIVEKIETVVELSTDELELAAAQEALRTDMNDYIARYRRDKKTGGLKSFTTMLTAINALAGYYTAYGTRPVSEKLQTRLGQQFKQVKIALKRGY